MSHRAVGYPARGREGSLGIIYVSWRDTETVVRSLGRLSRSVAAAGGPVELVVVVNQADDPDIERIASAWPGVTVIANRDNRGFGPACNQGARAISGDILLFLNPDTLAEPMALSAIREALASNPHVVGVAPRLIDQGGHGDERQRQFQLRRFPSLRSDVRELLLVDHIAPRNPWHRRARYLDEDRERPFVVEQPAAAALAVRREAFEAVGGFDERFWPAYWEDVDLCLRLAGRGQILYWPWARFEHVGGLAAGELGRSRFTALYYLNALRYRSKHYCRPARVAYRSLLWTGMAMRALAVLGKRDAESRDALRGYLMVAVMALRGQR